MEGADVPVDVTDVHRVALLDCRLVDWLMLELYVNVNAEKMDMLK